MAQTAIAAALDNAVHWPLGTTSTVWFAVITSLLTVVIESIADIFVAGRSVPARKT
jgi:hypothetical protein